MNEQDALKLVHEHFLNNPMGTHEGGCTYLGPDGQMCALGFLAKHKGLDWSHYTCFIQPEMAEELDLPWVFCNELQRTHDTLQSNKVLFLSAIRQMMQP